MRLAHDRSALAVLLVAGDPHDTSFVERVLREGIVHLQLERLDRVDTAIARIEAQSFDVVLLDLQVPDAHGTDTVMQVVRAAGDVPVVVLTGTDEELALRCLEAGAEDYVPNGAMDPSRVMTSVDHAISRARAKKLAFRLEQSQRFAAIGQLAAGVAHEVNNPTAFMLLNLEMMGRHVEALRGVLSERGASAHDACELLGHIDHLIRDTVEGVERIASVARHLRTFARERPPTFADVDLADVCRVAARLTQSEVRPRARLVLDLSEVPRVVTDGTALLQVLVNLLLNAAQAFTTPNPDTNRIFVRLEPGERWMTLWVEDCGAGVAPETLPKVFTPFFSTKSPSRHAGLGLSVCAELVEQLGGRMKLTSQVGAGTKVAVMLPRSQEKTLAPRRAS